MIWGMRRVSFFLFFALVLGGGYGVGLRGGFGADEGVVLRE